MEKHVWKKRIWERIRRSRSKKRKRKTKRSSSSSRNLLCLSVPSLPSQPFIIWLLLTRPQNILYIKYTHYIKPYSVACYLSLSHLSHQQHGTCLISLFLKTILLVSKILFPLMFSLMLLSLPFTTLNAYVTQERWRYLIFFTLLKGHINYITLMERKSTHQSEELTIVLQVEHRSESDKFRAPK